MTFNNRSCSKALQHLPSSGKAPTFRYLLSYKKESPSYSPVDLFWLSCYVGFALFYL